MNNVIKRIDIDLYSPTSYEVIKAQQGDNLSRIIEFALYDNGNPYTIPDNVVIYMEGHRGDNSSFEPKSCTVSQNIISCALDEDILYEAGAVEAKIVMYSDTTILSTIPFKIYVQKHPFDKNKIEKEKSSLINWLIQSIKKINDNFNDHINNKDNPHVVTKTQVGLGNADNTSDMDKPVSTAQQAALDKKVDKTTVATSSTLGLVKSGTDITVDSNGNVSVNDNSHNHTVSNISDLTATATELNVLDGIAASTEELNYVNGVTNNIQTQLDSKAPTASPTLTGIPKAPTASTGTNNTQIATTAFTQTTVNDHNTSSTAHDDIRNVISGLATRLNALADSDDTTLDQLSEIVAYIKSNRSLIENVTTNKVNYSDIIDSLDSTATNKALAVKAGNDLKREIDNLYSSMTYLLNNISDDFNEKVDKVPGKGLSTNDYTTAEKNKLAGISSGAEVNVQADWNETNASSDAYIKNKPTIPSGITVDSALSSTSTNPVQNKVINSALDKKVEKTTYASGDEKVSIKFDSIISNTSWNSCAFVANTKTALSENSYVRAGYGFQNSGYNACFLFLDTDFRLKYVDNTGRVFGLGNGVHRTQVYCYNGYCTINHGYNIIVNPIVTVNIFNHATIIYGIKDITNTSFSVGVAYCDNYVLSPIPNQTLIDITWTF